MSARSGRLAVLWSLLVVGAGRAGPTAEQVTRYEALDARELRTFSNVELAEYLALRQEVAPPADPAVEIGRLGRKALRTPFRRFAVRFDLGEADCVVFVERTIAMALARDWESYYRLCERLRHKDGAVAYKNRNFLTLGDWVPNNAWLLKDVTGQLGPRDDRPARPFTHVVRPKVFRESPTQDGHVRITFLGTDWKSGDKEVRTGLYIPRDRIQDVLGDLRTGDVALIIYGVGRNAGSDHMGLVCVEPSGAVTLLHCTPPGVRQEPLLQFAARHERVSGFMFLRLRDDARHGVERTMADATIQPLAPTAEDARVQALRDQRGGATPGPSLQKSPE